MKDYLAYVANTNRCPIFVGAQIMNSDSNEFTENTFKSSNIALRFHYSDYNKFFHNNFYAPTQIYGTHDNNIFYGVSEGAREGNFWSDYAGVDDGSGVGKFGEARFVGDGIGDTLVPHWDANWYPLMTHYEEMPILTPEEAIDELIQEVKRKKLPFGIENSLLKKLEHAKKMVLDEKPKTAINILDSFIHEVEALTGKWLSAYDAGQWLAKAQLIIDLIE